MNRKLVASIALKGQRSESVARQTTSTSILCPNQALAELSQVMFDQFQPTRPSLLQLEIGHL